MRPGGLPDFSDKNAGHRCIQVLYHYMIATRTYRKRDDHVLKKMAIGLVRFYRKYISPMKKPSCIYIPTCSQYAIEAIEKYGFFKGGFMSLMRILRCHPFAKGGYDPVK